MLEAQSVLHGHITSSDKILSREANHAAVPHTGKVFLKYLVAIFDDKSAHRIWVVLGKARVQLGHDLGLIGIMKHNVASRSEQGLHVSQVDLNNRDV